MRSRLLLMSIATLILAACGTVAETNPTFEPTNTGQPRLVLAEDEGDSEDAVGEESTAEAESVAVEPTTAPTATPEPTVEPTAAPTLEPTVVPTEEATEVVEEAAAPADTAPVMVNGEEITGYAADGEFWFSSIANSETGQMCITCHNPTEPLHGVGPYLYGIATVAGERVAGLSATDYLYESIVNPNAHLAPPQIGPEGQEVPWVEGLMPQNWGEQLEPTQIADLVAYLLTLNQELPE